MDFDNSPGRREVVIYLRDYYVDGNLQTNEKPVYLGFKIHPEELIAKALLQIEPEKFEGGSKARQDWIGLITWFVVFLSEHGYDVKKFKSVLEGDVPDGIGKELVNSVLEEFYHG